MNNLDTLADSHGRRIVLDFGEAAVQRAAAGLAGKSLA
jgi:hypothetical protein